MKIVILMLFYSVVVKKQNPDRRTGINWVGRIVFTNLKAIEDRFTRIR